MEMFAIHILAYKILRETIWFPSSFLFSYSDLKAGVPTLEAQEYARQDDSNYDLHMVSFNTA